MPRNADEHGDGQHEGRDLEPADDNAVENSDDEGDEKRDGNKQDSASHSGGPGADNAGKGQVDAHGEVDAPLRHNEKDAAPDDDRHDRLIDKQVQIEGREHLAAAGNLKEHKNDDKRGKRNNILKTYLFSFHQIITPMTDCSVKSSSRRMTPVTLPSFITIRRSAMPRTSVSSSDIRMVAMPFFFVSFIRE